jgi:hypothetical protein
MSVTANGSAHQGSPVTCHACERASHDRDRTNRELWEWSGPLHCATCHEDGHRACATCGACLPNNHRWDRFYCKTTCRVLAHVARQHAALERAVWEAEHPEEAAREQAEFEAYIAKLKSLYEAAGAPKVDKRRAELKDRAERCAECDKLFGAGDVIYRRGQPDGRHNKDAEEGYHYTECRCPGYGDRKWCEPEPCATCGRTVASDKESAEPRRFVRRWRRFSEDGEPLTRTFCCEHCRRRFHKTKREHEPRRCDVCPRTFTPTRSDSRYCSPACRQKAYRRRKAAS